MPENSSGVSSQRSNCLIVSVLPQLPFFPTLGPSHHPPPPAEECNEKWNELIEKSWIWTPGLTFTHYMALGKPLLPFGTLPRHTPTNRENHPLPDLQPPSHWRKNLLLLSVHPDAAPRCQTPPAKGKMRHAQVLPTIQKSPTRVSLPASHPDSPNQGPSTCPIASDKHWTIFLADYLPCSMRHSGWFHHLSIISNLSE